ncbi:MAG: lysylphosphatidylglycerol synthase transmembrane domain-containing protein [Candidatus Gastranaerophilaceae bacterium]|nr:lysylphosphatidylglycerol synthase transmembrane domain-containing protein [Candidatus Gastranaerophilaceae bacterium]
MKKSKIIPILITCILLVFIFYKINWSVLFTTFKTFDFKNIFIIVFLYITAMYMRGFRWKALLANNPKYSPVHLGEVFIVGSFLNAYLPARIGDLYRAYYLGNVKQEKKMKILGSVILERTLDGVTVLGILFIAILLYCRQQWILNIAYASAILFVGSLIIFFVVCKYNKVDFIKDKVISFSKCFPKNFSDKISAVTEKIASYSNSFIEGFEAFRDIRYFLSALFMSILIWGMECVVAWYVLTSFDLGFGFGASLFVISLISFSTMIPSASIFVGPYQYAYILALGIFGVSKSASLAVATVHQGIMMIVLAILGGMFLLKFNISVKDAVAEHNKS